MPLKPRPLPERFRSKLQVIKERGSCIEWQGAISSTGYGGYWLDGRQRLAHRVAWELAKGPIPAGLQIDHLCRNPRCVNPKHLEPVTPRENTMRSSSITAINARKTHCIHGHPFAGDNLAIQPKGGRKCRTCARRIQREKRERLAASSVLVCEAVAA